MTNEHGKTVAALPPGDPFALAYAAFERARAAFLEEVPEPKQFELTGKGHELMSRASDAMDAMMCIEAPTMFALFLKLRAIGECPWPWTIGDYHDRLTADAGTLALQFPKAWLDRFESHGGSAVLDRYNNFQLAIFIPCFSLSADAEALEARRKEADVDLSDDQRSWHAAFYDGAMRELAHILDEVPGARAGVAAIVADRPQAMPTQIEEAC